MRWPSPASPRIGRQAPGRPSTGSIAGCASFDILDHARRRSFSSTPSSKCSGPGLAFTQRRSDRPRGATPVDFAYAVHSRSATPASAPNKRPAFAAAHRATAIRSTSSPRRRRPRRRPGSALSSPARRAPAYAASSARNSARNISISAADPARRSARTAAFSSARSGSPDQSTARRSKISASRWARGSPAARPSMPLPTAAEDKNKVVPIAGRDAGKTRDRGADPRSHSRHGCISLAAVTAAGRPHRRIVTTGKGYDPYDRLRPLESFAEEPERWLDVAWSSEEAAAIPAASTLRSPTSRATSAA